jgi:hypothetical protein
VRFFYKISENLTVGNDLNCHIIVTAKMNEFPKRSKASISKQTNQYILKAFNKIKDTHGDNGNLIRKVQNCRSSADVFSVNPNLKLNFP